LGTGDRAHDESTPAAWLYGALLAPRSDAERQVLFESMRQRLEPSPVVFGFLEIMKNAPIVPWPLRSAQRLLICAAIDIVPGWVRERLGLGASCGLRTWERPLVRLAGKLADRVVFASGPAAQSCRRLGLPAGYPHRRSRQG
jgi:uncharacterized protein (DUF2236 family)